MKRRRLERSGCDVGTEEHYFEDERNGSAARRRKSDVGSVAWVKRAVEVVEAPHLAERSEKILKRPFLQSKIDGSGIYFGFRGGFEISESKEKSQKKVNVETPKP